MGNERTNPARWIGAMARAPAKALPPPDPLALLLGRSGHGATQAEWERARALGFEAWLEEQLAAEPARDAVLEQALAARLPTLVLDVPGLVAFAGNPQTQFLPAAELIAATIARQVYSQRQLFETMVEFWNNHFSVFLLDGPVRFFKSFEDRTAIRPHALGRFRDLLEASARSPAMLYYLDNYANAVGVANENYARELMELHALGADGGYTEADVREVARAFTGWTINVRAGDGFAFTPFRHDSGAKRVLGEALPAGQGIADGEAVLDLLASHPSTARFISLKLARRFVSDDPPAGLVDRLAAEFRATDGDIKALLRMLFTSPEFAASGDQKFKRPVEFVLSALRVTGARVQGDYVRAINNQFAAMGQVPFQWEPPDGYPDAKAYWLNTTALLNRWNFGFALAEGRFAPWMQIDAGTLAGDARTPAALVDRLAARLLRRSLDPADRDALLAFAAPGSAADAALGKRALGEATVALVGAMLASDYFQYR
jgi:uncharacterized protein (DUF1800 family)